MKKWLGCALEYISLWIEFQARMLQQPGCIVTIGHRGKVVLDQAFGSANLATGEALATRHRFRIGSQSKSFTAAGILKLREQGKLRLDDSAGRFVGGLYPAVACATIAQLLSHSAGLIRDGRGAEQFQGRRSFLSAGELITDLKGPQAIEPNTRFKYSNLGYGLLGLIMEAVSGESYSTWMKREIIDAVGLDATTPDMPLPLDAPCASGHSGAVLLGRRLVIPGEFKTHAICPAGGFVSTGADLVRFFAQLSPYSKRSVLSDGSRREMIRAHWRVPLAGVEHSYGLGIVSGLLGDWEWFGHSGALQGYISRTCVLPKQELTISILTNALDGWADAWVDGAIHILRAYAQKGASKGKVKDWRGRWWTLWGAYDLLPTGAGVIAVSPASLNPMLGAGEIKITGRNTGQLISSDNYGSEAEPVRCVRSKSGKIVEISIAGMKLLPGPRLARELTSRYGEGVALHIESEPGVAPNVLGGKSPEIVRKERDMSARRTGDQKAIGGSRTATRRGLF
jgi:CubicO group peptidase (beta-lactamase class C family)